MDDSQPHSEAKAIMGYTFLKVFADNDIIDADELAFIERLALRDGIVDDEEKKVLHEIFSRVGPDIEPPSVWEEICRFKKQYGIE